MKSTFPGQVIGWVRAPLAMLVVMTLILGGVYPLLVSGLAMVLFPAQAAGSLIVDNGTVAGSALIGQAFDAPDYFWGRLSATTPPYNGSASSGSNFGPLNPDLKRAIQSRVDALHAADPANPDQIPMDLVTSSGSGLDPHISPAAAIYQISRVAHARGITVERLRTLVDEYTEGRTLGVLGEPRVNVLLLNRALDAVR